MHLRQRPRRLRQNDVIRHLTEDVTLTPQHIIAPYFVKEGRNIQEPIPSMMGQFRWSIDKLLKELEILLTLGIKSVALFPVVDIKDKNAKASQAVSKNFFYLQAIRKIKKTFPEMLVVSDVALDPYTDHGHDGLVSSLTGEILNDQTIKVLTQMSLLQAEAGADIVAPSDMMDGRIGAIRDAFEENNFSQTLIMSYCAKYASSFYGPFRDALSSAPKKGDKKSYQMSYKNAYEVRRELQLDTEEGADIIMVKPALAYLDIIFQAKQLSILPVAAYQVSGEYAMIKSMPDAQSLMLECLYAIRRAGADIVLSYFAKEYAQWHRKNKTL